MRVIGVIDLLGGRAVHAKGGCRHGYRPIDVAGGVRIHGDATILARMYRHSLGLDELYVADLDAIAGGAEQESTVRAIAVACSEPRRTVGGPGCGAGVDVVGPGFSRAAQLWLDAGVSTVEQARRALNHGAACVIVGLETLTSFAALRDVTTAVGPDRVAFSLDLRDGRPVADDAFLRDLPPDVLAAEAADAGVRSIIVLDLARVGSGRGVDLTVLDAVRRAVPGVTLLAGGGVRDEDDLRQLGSAGCDGALVATALHGAAAVGFVQYATSLSSVTDR